MRSLSFSEMGHISQSGANNEAVTLLYLRRFLLQEPEQTPSIIHPPAPFMFPRTPLVTLLFSLTAPFPNSKPAYEILSSGYT